MVRIKRRLALCSLLLCCVLDSAMAQNDPQYVIKRRTDAGSDEIHYLAHRKSGSTWILEDATSFSPNCLWYSGNTVDHTGVNHNYYFLDGSVYHFLAAELDGGSNLFLSDTLPPTQLLRNTEQIYYFYDWDWDNKPIDGAGVARGYQHLGLTQAECEGQQYHSNWNTKGECWEAYWVECDGSSWKLSDASHYSITTNSARFRLVTVSETVTPVSGGLQSLNIPTTGYEMNYNQNKPLSATIGSYQYIAYSTYIFEGQTHNYYGGADHGTDTPDPNSPQSAGAVTNYSWTISGPGARYFSFHSADSVPTSTSSSPTLYYYKPNNTGHKTATLTLTVTYADGAKQSLSVPVTAKTPCQNPVPAAAPVITYHGVTVSWIATSEEYTLSWKKHSESTWKDTILNDVTSFTFTELAYNTQYDYKVKATCTPATATPTTYSFTTKSEPELLIKGAVFGGGRMANVTGNTEVVIINCDSIGAVFGGNDIAGSVQGANGSNIVLGIDASSEATSYAHLYNNDAASTKVRVNDVYGGGNGYYAYNGTSFQQANASTVTVAHNASVTALSETNQWNEPVWTNPSDTQDSVLTLPSIVKTAISVTNNVKIDSLFGGAKNAYLTTNSGNGDSIYINGGTILAVYGGNNLGGGQGYGLHYIKVKNTTTNPVGNIANTATTGFGRDFGIRYLFGGGNKVAGSTTDVHIEGGQLDTIFAGGNAADVYAANLTVDCSVDVASIAAQSSYKWDGISGVYNVRTLFGGNNEAPMEKVPNINLNAGTVGTVYGGGNAGDMLARDSLNGNQVLVLNDKHVKYGTHVTMNSADMLVDYLYGGCQVSNVDYSTWVEIKNGHVGTVYGGCNVSGDVGSTKIHPENQNVKTLEYQAVYGGAYVVASGGTVYKNLYAGSNGFYHCNNGISYITSSINYGDPEGNYIGMRIPTHNETSAIIKTGATVKGNVYAGGNLAPVGFTNTSSGNATIGFKPYPHFVGWASVRMEGGTVNGDVYGGGNMAAIYGSNEIKVMGGAIGGALYGGNDRLGQMAQMTNRVLPDGYDYASDGKTSLADVRTYLSITGRPDINTVYGGGNGAYNYDGTSNGGDMDYCSNEKPIQGFTFVDINIDGYKDGTVNGGHINTVYGGGNGVTVTGATTVFLNVKGATANAEPEDYDHVGTIFGGNNLGQLDILSNIVLLKGHVNTVYGGCNEGAMVGDKTVTSHDTTYQHVSSVVQLRDMYITGTGAAADTAYPTAQVTGAVYGGCRMNGVSKNSLVLVEGGTHSASIFGGSDISGAVNDTSHVVITGGTVGNVYGGGNGNYRYESGGNVYLGDSLVATGVTNAPTCSVSRIDFIDGQVGTDGSHTADIYGGGYGAGTSTSGNVLVNIGEANATSEAATPVIYGDIYGGSALGRVNTNSSNTTTVNFLNGALHGNLYGGGLGRKGSTSPAVDPIEAKVYGKVFVNISDATQNANNCFIDLRDANVYGCNNANGSPQDDVTVNVYKTAHSYSTYPTGVSGDNYLATYTGSTPKYSIQQVFGGGNEANYVPTNTSSKTQVNVFSCDNTIGRVFGGGNAADAYAVESNIYGGRFHQVFGGGNGDPTAANIGAGGASLNVYGGDILQLFGGNNLRGGITGPLLVNVTNTATCGEHIAEFFGGSNQASIGSAGSPANLITTIDCSDPKVVIDTVYGGSNLAEIIGNVTLNIKGGEYNEVFGGSKGASGTPANIDGKVTLNLFGGTIGNAFGGSNINGNITDTIIVNVLDYGSCGLDVTNVFGASNETAYEPTPTTIVSPIVNVMHIAQTDGVRGNVYGGGNKAPVTSNPKVNIGYVDSSMSSFIPTGYTVPSNSRAYVNGNVYGGGNEAGVTGDPVVNMNNGTVVSGIYGGCNTNGTVDGDINVNIYDGTLGTSSTEMTEGIYGGGKGHQTQTTGDVTVTIGDGSATPNIYSDVYGGSAFGQVGDDGKLTKVDLKKGTVHGKIFGGGKGDNTHTAEVTGNAEVAISGGSVLDSIFGGCNVKGIVIGDATVSVTGGTLGATSPEVRSNVYGGGLGENTKVKGDVAVTIDNNSGHIYGDVYGGSAKGLVNCNEDGDGANAGSTTTVTLTDGTIHGNLYGGGHGPTGENAHVYGPVTVNVNGANALVEAINGNGGTVFGGNNLHGTPQSTITVNLSNGTVKNVCGGGNQAAYAAPSGSLDYPAIYITGGTVTHKVVGGCNAANVTGNPHVNISGGTLCANATNANAGIFGGCNESGTVTGDIVVNITGTTTSQTTIGNTNAIEAGTPVSVHGGGYGSDTHTAGSITVNFGTDAGGTSSTADEYPKLYGDLYGGSALGQVNTETQHGLDSTNVNILNGTIFGGSVYGGGLGDGSNPAKVWGKVHVNIGAAPATASADPTGKATFSIHKVGENEFGGNVYGCNNINGSPQDQVYVDVYQTAHTQKDSVTYMADDRTYAIQNVFGGGNRANYAPVNQTTDSIYKVHNYIHECDNTIGRVYGGGNAADVDGTEVHVDGGRFHFIFGGGNGRTSPANVGYGDVELTVCSGHVGWKYVGCDMHGVVHGAAHDNVCPDSENICNEPLTVDYFFFGANQATVVGGLNDTIKCGQDMNYLNVYGGSRLAIIYGDINLVVRGGNITNLFGGSMGSAGSSGGQDAVAADIRKYPEDPEHDLTVPEDGRAELVQYMNTHHIQPGTGGNINIWLEGGHITNLYGGCDENGNIDGVITIIVDSTQIHPCELEVDTIYGGSRLARYQPVVDSQGATPISPVVYIKSGTVNYDVFGGSFGNPNATGYGTVFSNPKVTVGFENNTKKVRIGRDVFGGGSSGKVEGSTQVILRGKTTVGNNVYGGSKKSNVTGSTEVILNDN